MKTSSYLSLKNLISFSFEKGIEHVVSLLSVPVKMTIEKYKSNQSITVKTKKGERLEVSVEKGQGRWKCVDNEVEWLEPRIQRRRSCAGGGGCLSWLSPSMALG